MNNLSVFDIYKIGMGPSSSHTMGPWNIAKDFIHSINKKVNLHNIKSLEFKLQGSLSKTGAGHGTDKALLMGMMGFDIKTFDILKLDKHINQILKSKTIMLLNQYCIPFDLNKNIIYDNTSLELKYPNTIICTAYFNNNSKYIMEYYSIGGGFIECNNKKNHNLRLQKIPYPISNANDMKNWCLDQNMSLDEISLKNELCWNNLYSINNGLEEIWNVMLNSIYEGCRTDGLLPGGLKVKRRSKSICEKLLKKNSFNTVHEWIHILKKQSSDMNSVTNWISCFALAVNETNASFGKIVTAPTNGAAGVIPAVLLYNICFNNKKNSSIIKFLLVAAEIGMLFKKGATLSAADGGCQAEIGVASAMAAGALTHSLGGNIYQILMASEIAMEHHLGLTCDPIGGLVQIPCIERNAMGAIKAITACQLALNGNPKDARVSLDDVIATMWQTGQDMSEKYKETSEGGLAVQVAVNYTEC